jgi:hypothetical protein
MTAQSRLTPRDALETISPRGRRAGITVGAGLLVFGMTLVWAAWHALRCGLGGPAGEMVCGHAMGVGGLVSMLGLGLVAAGAGILWRTGRRLVDADGLSGWIVGEGITIVLSGVVITLLIPMYHCPAGYELTQVFHACRGISPEQVPALILHPPTWMVWKVAVVVGAIVVGIVVGRWRALPWPVASILTAGMLAAATLLLADRSVGLPSI